MQDDDDSVKVDHVEQYDPYENRQAIDIDNVPVNEEHVPVEPPPLRCSACNREPIAMLDPWTHGQDHAEVFLAQYSMNKGIKSFKQKGIDAIEKELKQLHDRETFSPIQVNEVSSKALEAHLFYRRRMTNQ